jgi:hypothetical protein
MKIDFGEHTVFSTQVLSDFLMFKNGMTSVKNSRCLGLPSWGIAETEESLFVISNMLEFYFGQFRTF